MGVLGWSPTEFWRATPWDLYFAIDGWQESQGIEQDPDTGGILTAAEVAELQELLWDDG